MATVWLQQPERRFFFSFILNSKMLLNIAHWTFNSPNVDSFHVNFYFVFSIKEILTLTLS